MGFFLMLLFIFVLLIHLCTSLGQNVVVTPPCGPLEGHKSPLSNSHKFLGIPFAQPPVKDLRWRAPQPLSPWKETRSAHILPASCTQSKNTLAWGPSQEDCLYLNVFAPSNATGGPYPVMVWFYGGSFMFGGTSIPIYDGEFDASALGVILVTVNYRLGVFGFLGSKELLQEGGTAGNYGILDQQAALRWVQANIAAFGGDAKSVTIFGQSAGGASVAAQLVSPLSTGLFHKAIMQSGPMCAWGSRPLSHAQATFDLVSSFLNCSSSSSSSSSSPSPSSPSSPSASLSVLSCMRELPTETVQHSPVADTGDIDWSPVIDGAVLEDDPQTLALEGKVKNVPVMLGTTQDEGTTLISLSQTATEADYLQWLTGQVGPDLVNQTMALYPLADYKSPWHTGVAAWTDWGMTCPARRSARWISAANSSTFSSPAARQPVFLYRFTHSPEVTQILKPDEGSFHGAELAFVFRLLPLDPTPGENHLSKVMSSMWASFARNGDPNKATFDAEIAGSVPAWKPYETAVDNDYVFDAGFVSLELQTQTAFHSNKCDFWDQHIKFHHN